MKFDVVLHDDKVHSVQEAFIAVYSICKFPVEQTLQCLQIIQQKGKYAVKDGTDIDTALYVSARFEEFGFYVEMNEKAMPSLS